MYKFYNPSYPLINTQDFDYISAGFSDDKPIEIKKFESAEELYNTYFYKEVKKNK